jgi:antitoxin component of MazEF toxin-antitoxin module
MKTVELKVTRIGNSRGVRLPADLLKRYRIGSLVMMEEKSEGILLRPTGNAVEKLSWKDTAMEMASSGEEWGDWDSASSDGMSSIPWTKASNRKVAEGKARYNKVLSQRKPA